MIDKSNQIDAIYLSIYPFWGLHWGTRHRRRIGSPFSHPPFYPSPSIPLLPTVRWHQPLWYIDIICAAPFGWLKCPLPNPSRLLLIHQSVLPTFSRFPTIRRPDCSRSAFRLRQSMECRSKLSNQRSYRISV